MLAESIFNFFLSFMTIFKKCCTYLVNFRYKLYFIFLTNIEKLTYFLIHFLDIFKFLKYFLKFSCSSKNSTYFSEISCIYKYVKSCICPLGLHYEIPECAYLSPRGIASKIQKCNQKHFYQIFLNSNPARN